MSIGYQLGKFELPANIFRPVANLNGAVNSLNELDSTIFVGGAFTNNSGVHMNHLAILDEALSLKEESVNSSLKAFPNPFTNEIILKGVNDGVNFTLINILGQIVSSGNVMNQKISNLEGLSKGVYVLQLNTESGQVTQTILK